MNRYFDTHMHLDLLKYDSLEKIIKEIEVDKIYVMAVTNLPELFEKLEKKIESKYIRVCLGFHPELIYDYQNQIFKMWTNLEKTRYIGEVGLDFSKQISENNKNIQIEFLKNLIVECEKYDNKIITIHSRKAEKQILEILKNVKKSKIIIHWYTGTMPLIENYIEKGFYFSINSNMIKTIKGREIIKRLPINKILLESDYPFLKGVKKRYEKSILEEIIVEISKIKIMNSEQVKKILFDNFKEILKLK